MEYYNIKINNAISCSPNTYRNVLFFILLLSQDRFHSETTFVRLALFMRSSDQAPNSCLTRAIIISGLNYHASLLTSL